MAALATVASPARMAIRRMANECGVDIQSSEAEHSKKSSMVESVDRVKMGWPDWENGS